MDWVSYTMLGGGSSLSLGAVPPCLVQPRAWSVDWF